MASEHGLDESYYKILIDERDVNSGSVTWLPIFTGTIIWYTLWTLIRNSSLYSHHYRDNGPSRIFQSSFKTSKRLGELKNFYVEFTGVHMLPIATSTSKLFSTSKSIRFKIQKFKNSKNFNFETIWSKRDSNLPDGHDRWSNWKKTFVDEFIVWAVVTVFAFIAIIFLGNTIFYNP